MDLRGMSSLTDFFIIATSTSHRQVLAITECVEDVLRQRGERVWHVEGLSPTQTPRPARADTRDREPAEGLSWVLMDCGDVVVHLFNPPARHFYQLERLWGDAPQQKIC